ncbi:MAG: hypothetical protein RIQ69_1933 [Pseudomonadota bacterium]
MELSHMTENVHAHDAVQTAPVISGMPNRSDILFLILLACVMATVAWVGVLAYKEGYKNEVTKHNGEAWVKWMKDNSEARAKEGFSIENCAASESERKRWGDCFKELTEKVAPLNNLSNPFTSVPVHFVAKCDPKDRSTIGAIFIEKLVATPPGSAVPVVASQLIDTDPIDTKLSLKLSVCDKGGYPIKVDEFEF